VKQDPAMWNRHADGLRAAALESLEIIKAKGAEGLFDVGDRIDKACGSCHLEYWYPGDKKSRAGESAKDRYLRQAQEIVALSALLNLASTPNLQVRIPIGAVGNWDLVVGS
jgi:hypothetical protein